MQSQVRVETAVERATRGKPMQLVALINEMLSKGYSVERMTQFAVRRYRIPLDVAYEAIQSVVIH